LNNRELFSTPGYQLLRHDIFVTIKNNRSMSPRRINFFDILLILIAGGLTSDPILDIIISGNVKKVCRCEIVRKANEVKND
jgi:hypothetical protein